MGGRAATLIFDGGCLSLETTFLLKSFKAVDSIDVRFSGSGFTTFWRTSAVFYEGPGFILEMEMLFTQEVSIGLLSLFF